MTPLADALHPSAEEIKRSRGLTFARAIVQRWVLRADEVVVMEATKHLAASGAPAARD